MSNIGDMKHYVRIQVLGGTSQNAYGEPSTTWGDLSNAWAQITPLSGTEAMTAKQLNPEVTHRIDMWYSADAVAQGRIVLGSRLFYIVSVVNVGEEGQFMSLLCVEKVK